MNKKQTKLLKLLIFFSLLSGFNFLTVVAQPKLDKTDRIRLAEAFRLADKLGDKLWSNWRKTPFAVLLITKENEFLIRHPKPSADFVLVGQDSLLKSKIYTRQRQFPPNLLATFPFEDTPTIVVGQAENTNQKHSTAWTIILLHEHFHQLQMSQNDYDKAVSELELAGNNNNGSWMLNYAFPYQDEAIGKQFILLSKLLNELLEIKKRKDFEPKLKEYLRVRSDLKEKLSQNDYKYFSFQVWQEGIARYTQYRIAKLASQKYKPTREFRNLSDYQTFSSVAEKTLKNIKNEISKMDLSKYQRVAFYPIGAGEGLLLEQVDRHWQKKYFSEKFYLERLFEKE